MGRPRGQWAGFGHWRARAVARARQATSRAGAAEAGWWRPCSSEAECLERSTRCQLVSGGAIQAAPGGELRRPIETPSPSSSSSSPAAQPSTTACISQALQEPHSSQAEAALPKTRQHARAPAGRSTLGRRGGRVGSVRRRDKAGGERKKEVLVRLPSGLWSGAFACSLFLPREKKQRKKVAFKSARPQVFCSFGGGYLPVETTLLLSSGTWRLCWSMEENTPSSRSNFLMQ